MGGTGESVIQMQTLNQICVKALAHFKSMVNTMCGLVTPPPTRWAAIDGRQKLLLTAYYVTSFPILARMNRRDGCTPRGLKFIDVNFSAAEQLAKKSSPQKQVNDATNNDTNDSNT